MIPCDPIETQAEVAQTGLSKEPQSGNAMPAIHQQPSAIAAFAAPNIFGDGGESKYIDRLPSWVQHLKRGAG